MKYFQRKFILVHIFILVSLVCIYVLNDYSLILVRKHMILQEHKYNKIYREIIKVYVFKDVLLKNILNTKNYVYSKRNKCF